MKRTAFTVLELLVVIVIILLIAALMFPVFSSVRKRARETSCINNLRQIYAAWSLYTSDHDGTPPWDFHMLVPYIKSREVLLCPDDVYGGFNSDTTARAGLPVSYDYKAFMFERVLPRPFQLIRDADPNFGFLLCYLHGRLYDARIGGKPTEANYCGKVLRVRRDGSVKAVDVPLRRYEYGQGRCMWELLTDEPMPKDYGQMDSIGKLCAGEIVCAR
ncbi:MAG: DUF1559 domain-containing protein [Chthonomonadetes bacterium]|nr:DUF1559 domain-containing protein [Chthonomonadetes bacterium]